MEVNQGFFKTIGLTASLLASSLPNGFRCIDQIGIAAETPIPIVRLEQSTLPSALRQEAREILSSYTQFSALHDTQQEALERLYVQGNAEQQAALLLLLQRTTTTEQSAALLNTDKDGKTLLDNLCHLFEQEVHPQLAAHANSLRTSMLQELTNPGELNQAGYGTCGTSILCFMYQERPAEICRIFNELCGEQGSCTTVSGARIFVPRFAYEPDRTSGRSDSERIIMAACMELANGESHSYCNHCDSNYDNDTGHMYSGLYDRDIKRLIEALTGETVTVRSTSEHSSQALADSLKKDLAEGKQVFLSMRWRHGSSSSKSHLRHLLPDQELGEDEGHTHAVGPAAPSTNAWSYHQVMALEVKNYRAWGQTLQGQMIQFDEPWLHYRNLHRLTQYQPGSELQNPRRRIINREGVEAMPLYQIQDRISRTYSFSPR